MRRRDFLRALNVLAAVAVLPGRHGIGTALAAVATEATAFSAAHVLEQARALAAKKFAPPKAELPQALRELGYDQYRDIRFKRERALWATEGMPFQVEFFHRGFIFSDPVTIHVVADGQAWPVAYTPDFFTFGPGIPPLSTDTITDFSGFRLRTPIHRSDTFDEFVVFQGASYFRALAKGQVYGLSARGLALNTGAPDGEEFPFFRTFWIERPRPEARAMVVHGLLDSVSTTGAYRFTIRPGEATMIDVELTLYPRVELQQVGLAPLTSMFFFAPHDRVGIDDFRPAVHDSDGLSIWNGRGEWLWRPVNNPNTLQVSAFVDDTPRGFGLLQRHRAFADYQDLEAQYERRPSLWVEPIGDWGVGAVQLVEIPSNSEFHDNIVAFWRPSQPLPAQAEYRFTYRLHWSWTPPLTSPLAHAVHTRTGVGPEQGTRLMVIDFVGGRLAELKPDSLVEPVITTSAGTVQHAVAQPNPATGGWRASFVLAPDKAPHCDLRGILQLGDEQLSEVWLYRWTP